MRAKVNWKGGDEDTIELKRIDESRTELKGSRWGQENWKGNK